MKYRAYKIEFWKEKEAKGLFQILPFYNVKHLSNIELLHELPFYDELSVVEISKAFRRYARSYKVEMIEPEDPLRHLEASNSSIEDLFKDLLNEMKGFKDQITVKVLLSKHRINEDKEYDILCLSRDFIQNRHWINEGSGWMIESIETQYVNIFIYSPLIGSTQIELPSR